MDRQIALRATGKIGQFGDMPHNKSLHRTKNPLRAFLAGGFRRYVQKRPSPMLIRKICAAALTSIVLWSGTVAADTASEFRGMEGWTIIATTQVEDEFEGCDFDKVIKFINGMVLKCSTFSYTYSFMPNAVIFAKSAKHKDMEFYQIKALIGDKLYDMSPQIKR